MSRLHTKTSCGVDCRGQTAWLLFDYTPTAFLSFSSTSPWVPTDQTELPLWSRRSTFYHAWRRAWAARASKPGVERRCHRWHFVGVNTEMCKYLIDFIFSFSGIVWKTGMESRIGRTRSDYLCLCLSNIIQLKANLGVLHLVLTGFFSNSDHLFTHVFLSDQRAFNDPTHSASSSYPVTMGTFLFSMELIMFVNILHEHPH